MVLCGACFTGPAPAQDATDEDIAALVAEGRRHIAQGNAENALRVFEEAIAKDPDNAEALFFTGFLYVQAGRLQEGIDVLSHSVELAPDRYRVRMLLARTQERIGNIDAALREFRRVIQDAPAGAPEAEEARQHISALAALMPETESTDDPDADRVELGPETGLETLIAAGRYRMANNDPAGALEAFELARDKQPDDPEVLFFIGNLNLQLGHGEPGVRALEQSLALTPQNYRLRLVLARAYENFATVEEALQQLRTVAALAPPGSSEALEAERHIERLTKSASASGAADPTVEVDDPVLERLDDIPSLLNEARARMARGDQQGALRAAEAAQSLDPSHAEVLYFIGNLRLQLGEVELGLRTLARSAALVPDNYRVRLVLARGYDRFGAPEHALREYRMVVGSAPAGAPEANDANDRIRLLAARVEARENPGAARQQFLALLEEYAIQDELLSEVLRGYITDNDVQGAQQLLEALVEQHPGDIRLRSYLVEIYERTNQIDAAAAQYEALIALLPPDSDMVDSLRGRALVLQGMQAVQARDFAAARDHFEALRILLPDDITAGINLAVAYHGLGERDQTETILSELAEKHPNNPDVQLRLGTLLLEQGRTAEGARALEEARILGTGGQTAVAAQQFLERVYAGDAGQQLRQEVHDGMLQERRARIEEDADDYAAWARFAATAQALNRPVDQREAFENMTRLQPEDNISWIRLGEVNETLNDFKAAEIAFQRGLELTPETDSMRVPLEERFELTAARRAFADNEFEEAKDRFQAINEQQPDNYIAHFYLALIYGGEGEYERSAASYEEVLRIVPTHGPAHFSLGMLYEQLRREEDALTEYRTALQHQLPGGLDVTARERLNALSRRLDGFSFGLSYSSGWDSNFNLSRDDANHEFRSSLSGSGTYRRKLHRKPIYLGLGLSGAYQTYHRSEFDVINLSVNPFASVYWLGLDWTLSVSVSESEALMSEVKLNTSTNASIGVSGTFTLPRLLGWLGDAQRDSGFWDLSVSASRFESETSPLFDADSYTIGGTLNQSFGIGWRWTLGYNYTENKNHEAVGDDFAYTGHSVSAQLIRFLRQGWSVNGGYSTSYLLYTNPDSVTLFTRKRKNFTQNLSVGTNYFLSPQLRLFATMSYRFNESNLPTGFILSPEDSATAIGLQSSSLGDYSNLSVSMGVAFTF